MSDGPESGDGFNPDEIKNEKFPPVDKSIFPKTELTPEQRQKLQTYLELQLAAQRAEEDVGERLDALLANKELRMREFRKPPSLQEAPSEKRGVSIGQLPRLASSYMEALGIELPPEGPPLKSFFNDEQLRILEELFPGSETDQNPKQTLQDATETAQGSSEQQESAETNTPSSLLDLWLAGQAAEKKLSELFPDTSLEPTQPQGEETLIDKDPLKLKEFYMRKLGLTSSELNNEEPFFNEEQLKALQKLYPSTTEQNSPSDEKPSDTSSE